MTNEDHVIVINPEGFNPAAYEKMYEIPSVKSVTVVPGKGLFGDVSAAREITADEWAKTTVLVTGRTLPPSIDAVPNLKYVQLFAAGSNALVADPFYKLGKAKGVLFSTASGTHGPQISEWVILVMLAHFRHLKDTYEWQAMKKWGSSPELSTPLSDTYGRTIGILGYGGIGRQTARVAKALGMKVVVHTNSPVTRRPRVEVAVPGAGDPDGSLPDEWFGGSDQFEKFLSFGLDVLVVTLPLTPATTKLINADALKLLKGVYIINVGRGPTIDTNALIEACTSGHIAGAALDVTDPEPLPSDHPLWTTPNVLISPHISGHSNRCDGRVTNITMENIRQLQTTAKYVNEVDDVKGY
ncbi:hypothetical protein V1511DRAFT_519970 [Dipodascopsis uninucleata]